VIGKTLAHYYIIEKIGAGGMGIVFRAHDLQLDRDVALKVLPAETLTDETARARLLREARMASKLNHPHVCTIHEVGEADGQAYIAMELVEGKSLSTLLEGGALPVEQVLRYGQQVADALAHAHERGVIHRDLKSANVVITPEGRAKVLDFGLAKRLGGESAAEGTTVTQATLTAPGSLTGTLAYMAPEQLRGQPADARSDIWALGVMLYEMAAGRRPFQGQTGFELSSAILNQTPPPLPGSVPGELGVVVERCLAKEPGERYQRAGEVSAALEAIGLGTMAPWAAWRYTLMRRRWLALAAAVVVVLLIVAALNYDWLRTRISGGPPRVQSLAVLPLENLSGDAEQDCLADGTHEALITKLAQIKGLRQVVNRHSVLRYRKTDKSLPQIGRELGVDALITGSVLHSGNRVRVTAHLVRASSEEQLWTDSYEREYRDVLSMQNEIVSAITQSISLQLTPQEKARLAHARQVNPETYEAYLKGMFYFNKRTPEGYTIGMKLLQQAIDKDPADPLPYAGLALGIAIIAHGSGSIVPTVDFPRARTAALKAIELDENSPEAHVALAAVKLYYEWDWPGTEREFLRALELNPKSADAHEHYGWYLLLFNRGEEGLVEVKRAQELEPLAPIYIAWAASMYLELSQPDIAIQEAQKALDLDPNISDGLFVLGSAYAQKKMMDQAIAVHQKLATVNPDWKRALAGTYAQAGRKDDALKVVAELARENYPKFGVYIAGVQEMLGNKEETIRALQAAYEFHHPLLPWVLCFPEAFTWSSDPRYQELWRRMNFRH